MLNNFSKNSSEKPRHSQNGRFISHSTPRIGEDHQTPISSWSRWVRRGDRREPLDGPFAPILGTGTGPLALSPPDFSLYWAGDARYCKGVAPTFFLRLLVIRLCGALCSTTTENMNPVKKLKSKLDEQMPWPTVDFTTNSNHCDNKRYIGSFRREAPSTMVSYVIQWLATERHNTPLVERPCSPPNERSHQPSANHTTSNNLQTHAAGVCK